MSLVLFYAAYITDEEHVLKSPSLQVVLIYNVFSSYIPSRSKPSSWITPFFAFTLNQLLFEGFRFSPFSINILNSISLCVGCFLFAETSPRLPSCLYQFCCISDHPFFLFFLFFCYLSNTSTLLEILVRLRLPSLLIWFCLCHWAFLRSPLAPFVAFTGFFIFICFLFHLKLSLCSAFRDIQLQLYCSLILSPFSIRTCYSLKLIQLFFSFHLRRVLSIHHPKTEISSLWNFFHGLITVQAISIPHFTFLIIWLLFWKYSFPPLKYIFILWAFLRLLLDCKVSFGLPTVYLWFWFFIFHFCFSWFLKIFILSFFLSFDSSFLRAIPFLSYLYVYNLYFIFAFLH